MKIVYLVSLVLLSAATHAQGIVQHGPNDVYYALDIFEGKNNRLFLGTSGGLYYSDNHGDDWKLVNHYMNSIYMEPHFAVDPKTNDLYVGGSQGDIYSSPDNGVTWNPYWLAFPPNDQQIQNLAVAGDTLWVGTRNGLMYFQGRETIKTFTYVPSLQGTYISGLYVSGKTIVAATRGSGIQRSIDGGVTWSAMNTGLPTNFNAYGIRIRPGRSYTFGLEGFFYSDDQGQTWHAQTNGLTNMQVNDLAIVGDALYITTFSYSSVWRLTAGSNTWELIDTGVPTHDGTMESIWADDDEIIVGGWHGIFKKKASDGEFHKAYTGVRDAAWFSDLGASSDGTIWATASHNGVFRMKPGESEFQPFMRQVTNYGRTQPLRHDTLVVVMDYKLSFFDALSGEEKGSMTYTNVMFAQDYVKAWGRIFLSTLQDGVYQYEGTPVWRPINDGMANLHVAQLLFFDNKLWAATEDGLYSRTRDATSWTRVVFGATETIGIRTFVAEGNVMLIGGLDAKSYLSTDGGATWKRINALDDKFVEAFTIHDDRVYVAASMLYVSSTDKQTWTGFEISPYAVTSLNVINGRLYMGTIERGILSVPLSWFNRSMQTIAAASLPTTVAVGTPLTLDATASSGLPVKYTLMSGDATLEVNKLTIHSVGRVVIEARQEGNDSYLPARKELTLDAVAVTANEDERNELISVYPVPADDYLVVSLPADNPSLVTLTDVQGRTLLRQDFVGEARLDLTGIRPGIYLVAVTKEATTVRRRIVRK